METYGSAADVDAALKSWHREAMSGQPGIAELWSKGQTEQTGYAHTLAEMLQQPVTWPGSALAALNARDELSAMLESTEAVVLTGSGSSEYAGACVAPALRAELRRPVSSVGGGVFLTEGAAALPHPMSAVVSLARSGDSPESCGAVDLLLEAAPSARHLVITCNPRGRLAVKYGSDSRVTIIQLDPRTNDRSLVMTSSFTNMVIASRSLGLLDATQQYEAAVRSLCAGARHILSSVFDTLGEVSRGPVQRAVFLGTGCRFGAARESALKMLEMTAGRIVTMAETYLGLRHGPMAFLDEGTLLVCFLSTDPVNRAYELDLVEEVNRKQLGWRKVLVGQSIPSALLREGDVAIEYGVDQSMADTDAPVLDVLVGQVLAFHKCLALGLSPDSPSEEGVISRVVSRFTLHSRRQERVR